MGSFAQRAAKLDHLRVALRAGIVTERDLRIGVLGSHPLAHCDQRCFVLVQDLDVVREVTQSNACGTPTRRLQYKQASGGPSGWMPSSSAVTTGGVNAIFVMPPT